MPRQPVAAVRSSPASSFTKSKSHENHSLPPRFNLRLGPPSRVHPAGPHQPTVATAAPAADGRLLSAAASAGGRNHLRRSTATDAGAAGRSGPRPTGAGFLLDRRKLGVERTGAQIWLGRRSLGTPAASGRPLGRGPLGKTGRRQRLYRGHLALSCSGRGQKSGQPDFGGGAKAPARRPMTAPTIERARGPVWALRPGWRMNRSARVVLCPVFGRRFREHPTRARINRTGGRQEELRGRRSNPSNHP
jgi:hypothetical protein